MLHPGKASTKSLGRSTSTATTSYMRLQAGFNLEGARHPVSSAHEQLAWEQALFKDEVTCDAAAEPSSEHCAQLDSESFSDAVLHTSHPAAATREECLAWEDALNSHPGQSMSCINQQHDAASGLYAVVECGSHSTRLLLSTGQQDVARLSIDTHLGAAVPPSYDASAADQLSSQASILSTAAATLAAVQEYSLLLEQYQPRLRACKVVATAAIRQSQNQGVITDAISQLLGRPVQVVTGHEEAVLAFKGATASLRDAALSSGGAAGEPANSTPLCAVVDLGGRSTEVAVGQAGRCPQLTASIPLGCLSVMQAASSSLGDNLSLPDSNHLNKAAEDILAAHINHLADVHHAITVHCEQPRQQQLEGAVLAVIFTGGTASTVAALCLKLQEYDHDAVHMTTLRCQQLQDVQKQFSAGGGSCGDLPSWLTPARAATLAAGCAGLLAVMHWLGVDRVTVSDSDLLDGALSELQQ